MLVSRQASSTRRRSAGFTLIELITAITIMAVLAGLAAPSFSSFIANQRIRNTSFDLMAALMLARSEAVTRNGDVSFVKTGDEWSAGWKVKVGTNDILDQPALSKLSITDSADLSTITYGKDGRANTGATRFTIAPSSEMSGVSARCISIGTSGLPSSRVGACS
jgi:type IV fimbrial biogenesis protein FimT